MKQSDFPPFYLKDDPYAERFRPARQYVARRMLAENLGIAATYTAFLTANGSYDRPWLAGSAIVGGLVLAGVGPRVVRRLEGPPTLGGAEFSLRRKAVDSVLPTIAIEKGQTVASTLEAAQQRMKKRAWAIIDGSPPDGLPFADALEIELSAHQRVLRHLGESPTVAMAGLACCAVSAYEFLGRTLREEVGPSKQPGREWAQGVVSACFTVMSDHLPLDPSGDFADWGQYAAAVATRPAARDALQLELRFVSGYEHGRLDKY
ncbi:MAG: hypothetical protein WBP03_02775 [Candidatus Saccharimonadales bacterium]